MLQEKVMKKQTEKMKSDAEKRSNGVQLHFLTTAQFKYPKQTCRCRNEVSVEVSRGLDMQIVKL